MAIASSVAIAPSSSRSREPGLSGDTASPAAAPAPSRTVRRRPSPPTTMPVAAGSPRPHWMPANMTGASSASRNHFQASGAAETGAGRHDQHNAGKSEQQSDQAQPAKTLDSRNDADDESKGRRQREHERHDAGRKLRRDVGQERNRQTDHQRADDDVTCEMLGAIRRAARRAASGRPRAPIRRRTTARKNTPVAGTPAFAAILLTLNIAP